jgi:hypothetical protein
MTYKPNIASIDGLNQLWQSCRHHWKDTWMDYQNLFEGKTCVDIGIWKGLLNARAEKQFNCKTKIGVEPNLTNRTDCKKLNPYTELYPTIEDLPDTIDTDILLLHGVICLMGTHWIQEMENLLPKVNCKHIHIRHLKTYAISHGEVCTEKDDRQGNRYNLKSYKESPTTNEIIEFLSKKNFNLTSSKNTDGENIIMTFERIS